MVYVMHICCDSMTRCDCMVSVNGLMALVAREESLAVVAAAAAAAAGVSRRK